MIAKIKKTVLFVGLAFIIIGIFGLSYTYQLDHRSAESFEIRNILPGRLSDCTRKIDTASFYYDIYIIALPTKEAVPHIATYDICPYLLPCSHFAYYPEDFPVQKL